MEKESDEMKKFSLKLLIFNLMAATGFQKRWDWFVCVYHPVASPRLPAPLSEHLGTEISSMMGEAEDSAAEDEAITFGS